VSRQDISTAQYFKSTEPLKIWGKNNSPKAFAFGEVVPAPGLGWLGADRCEVWRDVFVIGGVAAQDDAPLGGEDGTVAEHELRSRRERKLKGGALAPCRAEEVPDCHARIVEIGQVWPGAGGVAAQVGAEYFLRLFLG